jgi:dolichyl-phosphate beta-glucosyltransferase
MYSSEIFLSVVIPIYNEEHRLKTPMPSLFQYLKNNFANWEVVLVDDGSTDGTSLLLSQIEKEHPGVRALRSERNYGKGNAVRVGMKAAKGNMVLFSDADFSTPIEDASKLLQALSQGSDVAIGSRGLNSSNVEIRQSWIRENMGKTFNRIIKMLLPIPFQDTQCGFKMFRKQAADVILPRMQMHGFAFDVEMLIIAQIHGMKISEVPVTWRNAKGSKVHPIRSSLEMLRDAWTIRGRMRRNEYK